MKNPSNYLIILISFLLSTSLNAQWSNKQFIHGGVNRQYRVYEPANYNPSNPASLVLTLHGMGDNMTNFSGIGMNLIADTANIIVVVPQALNDQYVGTSWNSKAGYMGYFPNSTVDDLDFLRDLIDSIKVNYAINSQRVYACGFSMGGFMTQRLACESADIFTAIASVSGTIGNGMTSCNPAKPISVAHFHGTSDQTIAYSGNQYGLDVDSLINFWKGINSCSITGSSEALADIASDGYTVDHFAYDNGGLNTEVELFKVNGADHVWLTAANDINYSIEIWKFFSRFEGTTNEINEEEESDIKIYPNPVVDELVIDAEEFNSFEIFNIDGSLVTKGNIKNQEKIDLSFIMNGNYLLILKDNSGRQEIRKIIVNKN